MEQVVKRLQKMSGFVQSKAGFSLLELIVALAIIGIVLTAALPNFIKRKPGYEQKAFITQLNAFMAQAWQQGLVTQKIQKIVVSTQNKKITLEQETGTDDGKGEPLFQQLTLPYIPTVLVIPESLEIRQFFVQGVDEFSGGASKRSTEAVWFFIVPGGMAQEVVINMFATQGKDAGQEDKEMSLVLNPFTAQFKMYDVFQNPA